MKLLPSWLGNGNEYKVRVREFDVLLISPNHMKQPESDYCSCIALSLPNKVVLNSYSIFHTESNVVPHVVKQPNSFAAKFEQQLSQAFLLAIICSKAACLFPKK
ncbi:hypothetical protein ACJX0J_030278 [Zea mays]